MIPDETTAQLLAIGHGFDWRAWPPEDRTEAARQFLSQAAETARISVKSMERLCKAIDGKGKA